MLIFFVPVIFVLLFDIFYISCAITHWIVSGEGRIEAQYDSIFTLKRPYDLVAFINQEKLAKDVTSHLDEMMVRKEELEKKWSTVGIAGDIEQELITYDDDCVKAKNTLEDGDLFMNVIDYSCDEIQFEQNLPDDKKLKDYGELNCKKFSRIEFSMATFPHFQVLYQTWNLTWPKETEIKLPFTVKQIYYGLSKNKTNWYLYNMASLYWRRMGNSQKALECVKRAVHFAPRELKDTPLFNLGVMLHRAQCTAEAAIVLHAAIDHASHKPYAHFVLGNVYALLGDYNRSVACYNNAVGLDPDWALARSMRHSVVCHKKVKDRLYDLQRTISEIVVDLEDFQIIQEEWLKYHEEILRQQAPANSSFTISFTDKLENKPKKSCSGSKRNSMEIHSCDITPHFNFKGHKIEGDLASVQALSILVEEQARKISERLNNPMKFIKEAKLHSSPHPNEQFIPFRFDSDLNEFRSFSTNEY